MMEILDGMSMDVELTEREKLRAVFPQCFVEGKLDIDKLLNLCGEYIDDDFEKYEFKWKGKTEALQLAGLRSTGTLRPCAEESVDFDSTQNVYIEGDNLEVLKLLQRSYFRKVKMIYIDPPYNTGNDFVYADDFADPMARYKEITQQATKSNPETMGRFHTNWLNMMYPRLRLAVNLLRDDGVCFISIDDSEVHSLRKVCDEVFGEENFAATIVWQKKQSPQNDAVNFSAMHDYILVYAKQLRSTRDEEGGWVRNLLARDENDARYANPDDDPRGKWASADLTCNKTAQERPNLYYAIVNPNTGKEVWPSKQRVWICERATMQRLLDEKRLWWGEGGNNVPRQKKYLSEVQGGIVPSTWWDRSFASDNQAARREVRALFPEQDGDFSYPKPVSLIRRMLQIATAPEEGDIVFDFFSGSATTAHAVMQQNAEDGGNRRFIMVQLPELCDEKSEAYKAGYKNICEIGKERIRRAGAKVKAERDGQTKLGEEENTPQDIGFRVFKLDTSNNKVWDSSPVSEENIHLLEQRLNDMIDRVKPDRTDLDMVFEVMLKLGLPLTETIIPLDIDGKTAYSIREDCLLMVCLEPDITVEQVEQMADYTPGRIVFGQSCFPDVTSMSNAKLTLRDRGVEMKFI